MELIKPEIFNCPEETFAKLSGTINMRELLRLAVTVTDSKQTQNSSVQYDQ